MSTEEYRLFWEALVEGVNCDKVLVVFGRFSRRLGVTCPFDIVFDPIAVFLCVQDIVNLVFEVVINLHRREWWDDLFWNGCRRSRDQ